MKGVLHRLPDQVAHQFHQRHLLQVLRQFPYWYQPLGRFYQHLSPSRIIVFGYVTLWQAIQVRSLLLNMWEHRLEMAVGLHQENLFLYISFVLPHDPQVYRLHLKCQNTQQCLYRPTKTTSYSASSGQNSFGGIRAPTWGPPTSSPSHTSNSGAQLLPPLAKKETDDDNWNFGKMRRSSLILRRSTVH